jgi:hypothetical protein
VFFKGINQMPELLVPDMEVEQNEIDQMSPSALAQLNRGDHAAMVYTANLPGNRRRLVEFDSKLRSYANHSQPIALSMFYSLPRAGKQIIGPSIRFAEIVGPCWKNCRTDSRALGDDGNTVTGQGLFFDYENNYCNVTSMPRRITDKNGQRYNDDMIVTTLNAAMAVAKRNAVLSGVPRALWTPAYEDAQLTAVGKAASHAQRVADAMEYLHKLGITEWQILNSVGVPSPKELEIEHLVTLRVLCSELKRGDKTVEEVFGSPYDKEITSLFTQLKMNDAQQRMLRQSYMGRAKELAEYLNGRLGPSRPAPAKTQPAPPAAVAGEEPRPQQDAEWPQQDVEPMPQAAPETITEAPETVAVELTATDFGFGENAPPEEYTAPPKPRGRPRKPPQSVPVEPEQGDTRDDAFAF